MIHTLSQKAPSLWRQILRQNLTRIEQLTHLLELNDEQAQQFLARPRFAINIPLRLAQKIKKGTLDDPLLRQFVPLIDEQEEKQGFSLDPIGDQLVRRESKLLHKYEGRVLIVCTSACAMHCRYCFRQNFDYDTADKSFEEELTLIRNDPSIHEVILSGGDPLSLSNETLADLLEALNKIPSITRIRFHSRFPVGIPERIDRGFLELIERLNKQVWFVVHINHSNEVDEDVLGALKELQKRGCLILNQSVLLKGVNDDVQTLKHLCEYLVDHGILPYYLHQLDRVRGAAHFEVPEEKGRQLIQEISKCLPGYAVPKYVREIAGEPNKTPL